MKKIINLLFVLGFISVFNYQTTAQNNVAKTHRAEREKTLQ